jgi:hypothetical protein
MTQTQTSGVRNFRQTLLQAEHCRECRCEGQKIQSTFPHLPPPEDNGTNSHYAHQHPNRGLTEINNSPENG